MFSRIFYYFVVLFFLVMNVLLWRAQFGARHGLGSAIPVETVWRKMLQAPDASRLEIRRHGKKIGDGTWEPKIVGGTVPANQTPDEEEVEPEGMIEDPTGYNIDFSGNFSIENQTRLRFGLDLRFTTNRLWQFLTLHVGIRPTFVEISAAAAAQTVKVTIDDETGHIEQNLKFSDLQNPEKLLQLVGAPFSPAILAGLGLPRNLTQTTPNALGVHWEARHDWLSIGKERMRAYRLQAQLLGRFTMTFFISLEGEILRVELPDDILLVNYQLALLQ